MKAAESIRNIYTNASAGRLLLLIFLVTFLVRILFLDLKLYHHDEAIHAWFVYELLTKGNYIYDPMYHGPFLYYVTAVMFSLFGESDVIGRILPVIFGSCLIPLLYAIFRLGYLTKNQVIIAGLFIAVSPDMVYFSRFLRHDIFQIFFTLAFIVCVLAWFEKERWYYAALAGLTAALGMTCKEDMPITLLIFGSFFLLCLVTKKISLPRFWIRHLFPAIIVAGFIGILFYSSFGASPETVFNAGFRAIDHWASMHEECRLCGPPYYYILMLLMYELPVLLLALFAVIQYSVLHIKRKKQDISLEKNELHPQKTDTVSVIHRDKTEFFFIFSLYWMIFSLCVYGIIGEKVPWLLLHQLLPMIFVAVYMMGTKKMILSLLICLYLIGMTWHLCFIPVDINEPIVQVQNSEQFREVMDLIDLSDKVVIASDTYWPLPWYYRGDQWEKFTFYGQRVDEEIIYQNDPDMVITHDTDSYPSLFGYYMYPYVHSYWFSWWDNKERLLPYFLYRDGKMGSINLDVFIKADIAEKYGFLPSSSPLIQENRSDMDSLINEKYGYVPSHVPGMDNNVSGNLDRSSFHMIA